MSAPDTIGPKKKNFSVMKKDMVAVLLCKGSIEGDLEGWVFPAWGFDSMSTYAPLERQWVCMSPNSLGRFRDCQRSG